MPWARDRAPRAVRAAALKYDRINQFLFLSHHTHPKEAVAPVAVLHSTLARSSKSRAPWRCCGTQLRHNTARTYPEDVGFVISLTYFAMDHHGGIFLFSRRQAAAGMENLIRISGGRGELLFSAETQITQAKAQKNRTKQRLYSRFLPVLRSKTGRQKPARCCA